MRHSYADILFGVGEFGPWQLKRLLILWLIMFMSGAQYALLQLAMFKQDEFICLPRGSPINAGFTANCTLNISEDGRVIADGSNWRFANRSASIHEKVLKYNYHHVFPRFYRLHPNHPLNRGYGNGFQSDNLFLTKVQELFMTNTFCKVNNPFRDNNGNCYWNEKSTESIHRYKCIGGEDSDQYYYNPRLNKSEEHEHGLICMNYQERSIINGLGTAGMIVGCLAIYILAAKLGRRLALAAAMLVVMLAGFLFVFHRKLHYSILYVGLLLYGFGRLAIFQVCYNYLVEIAGFRKKVFSVGPFDFTYNSLFGTSFAIPFVLGSMIGGSAFFHYQHHSPNLFYIAYSSFFVIPLLALPFLPESPRWLIRGEFYGRAEEVLTEIGKENNEEVNVTVHPITLNKKRDLDGAQILSRVFVTFNNPSKEDVFVETRNYSLRLTFFGAELALATSCFVWCWFMRGMMTVLVDYQDVIEENEFFRRRSYELIGIILIMFLENIFGRRGWLMILQIMTAMTFLIGSIYAHATSQLFDTESRENYEETSLDALALSNTSMTTVLIWYCLSIYPTDMR